MPLPYTPPQIRVFQEFNAIPAEITNPLRAWLIAPNARLVRYAAADEKELGALGEYDPDEEVGYLWPEKTSGSIIDQAYTKVFIDEAKLRYFQDLIGDDLTIAPVSGKPNRIRAATGSFKTVTAAARLGALYDRDVTVGDLAKVWSADGSLDTYVRGLVAEAVASSVAAAGALAANQATVTQEITYDQTAGDVNWLSPEVSLTGYSSLPDGIVSDTYTITVTQASTGGDLTTGRFSVRTSSGFISLDNVTPAAADAKATIDVRGLSFGFNLAEEEPLDYTDGADTDDLILGQTWTVEIRMAYTAPTGTSGGTYVGTQDNVYTVRCIQGGTYADSDETKRPIVRVTSAVGTDSIQAVQMDTGTQAIPLGAGGATLTLATNTTNLRKGDGFTVAVTAATTGRVSTIVLGHDLPTAMQDDTDLNVELYIQKDIEVAQYVQSPAPKTNWETSETEVTLAADVMAYDDSWTSGGTALAMPVVGGSLFVEYREWLNELTGIFGGTTTEVLEDIPGPLHADNPLKWHVAKAIANSNGTTVHYSAVADPTDDDLWLTTLNLGLERQDIYHIVAVTDRQTIFDSVVAHVNSLSSPEMTQYRTMFVPLVVEPVTAVVDANNSSDELVVKATIADDAGTSGTQYTIVTQTTGNAPFIEAGVAAGDTFRVNYALDEFGQTVYESYAIAEVISETTLRLETGPAAAVTVATQFEIWHTNTKPEQVVQLGERAAAYANRRVRAMWVNGFVSGSPAVSATAASAAVSGLLSGVVPHQHVTNIPISGLTELVGSEPYFNQTQLNELAAYGVWIIDRNTSGVIYTRDALTTDMTSLQSKTEMVTRNLDSISYLLMSRLTDFVGRANVVPDALAQIRLRLEGGLEFLKTFSVTASLGSQLLEGTEIRVVRQHQVQLDEVQIIIDLAMPFPINKLSLFLRA